MTISDALFGGILNAAPHDANGHGTFSAIQFDKAIFEGDAGFGGATFKGDARFGEATFKGDADFSEATFEDNAFFYKATFKGDAGFDRAMFEGGVGFGAMFEGDAAFGRATFKGFALFDGATFEGDAGFGEATFEGDALFGATFEGAAAFGKATFKANAGFGGMFEGDAEFGEAKFEGDAEFGEAKFEGDAEFGEAMFEGDAGFHMATFEYGAGFDRATFKGDAGFGGAAFKSFAGFGRATFKANARFDMATFEYDAWFGRATFEGDAAFGMATFKGNARFGKATFEGDAAFGRATFEGDAAFGKATFKGDVPMLGPVMVEGRLDLDGVQFASAVRIDTSATALTCRRARFSGGVRFDIRQALIRLDDSDLSVPSLLTGPPVSDPNGIAGRPELLSFQGANVAGLAVGNVSLADCRFAGAHNLDKLRLEADTAFGFSPAIAWWERRQVIAEEAAWRATKRPSRWRSPPWPDQGDEPEPLSPGAVAVLYRALRKCREDANDEPGAADFYYGEMEMRRHDRGTGDANRWRGRATRILLWVYWLVSGYGLRASRSIAALTVVTALFAAAFYFIGFITPPKPASYWTSLLYAFRSTISLTDSQVTLTAWGSFLQALLRITGPVLLGLTLLALRARVKR